MFKNSGEKKFKKRFPGLKQVINDREIDFEMYSQVPLKLGTNFVYLKASDDTRTVYTEFEVDNNHTYGLRISYNYQYIISEIKKPFLLMVLASIMLSISAQLYIAPYFQYVYLISVLFSVVMYYAVVEYLVRCLGISAYKVEVVANEK